MWSFLSTAIALLKTQLRPKPNKQPISPPQSIASALLALSLAPGTSTKLTPPPFSKPPFCCPSHQIPTYSSTSQTLTLFLRALIIRRQQIYAKSAPSSSSTSASSSSPEALFRSLSLPSYPLTFSSPHELQIIELETITSAKSYSHSFKHRYFIPVPGREMGDIENDPGDGFREVSINWVEERRKEVDGKWGFVTKDQVEDNRAGWGCDTCEWGFWVRLTKLGP